MEAIRVPFAELERIANNRPHPDIDPSLPKTTDGTTAAQVRKTPRRIVQQIPLGDASVEQDEGLSILANHILQNEIIPNSVTQDDVLGKSWNGIEDALTFGSGDALVFYTVNGDYFGTDWKRPYKKDIYTEAYKGTFQECNILFVRAWYQESDIDAIIDREESLIKSNKERQKAQKDAGEKVEEDYKPTWELDVLKKIKTTRKDKDTKDKSDTEVDKQIKTGGVEIVHGFQKGKDAMFYSFVAGDGTKGSICRRMKNPDPRGIMPLHRMYYENDFTNPEGRGVVELVAPLQNYLDGSLQAYQYIRALMYNPPLLKRGIPSSVIQYIPNGVIDMGDNPNSSLTPLKLDTSAIANFSNDFGLYKSQILNIFSGSDTSISATVGNPGFSKTDAGVKSRDNVMGVDDNYVRKRYERWMQDIFGTQLNLYFALTEGDRTFYLDEATFAKLAKHQSEYFTLDEKDNSVVVHFSLIKDIPVTFKTEASTSKASDNEESKEKLMEFLKALGDYGLLNSVNVQMILRRLVVLIGLEEPEEIVPDQQEVNGQQGNQDTADYTPEEQQVMQNLMANGYPQEFAVEGIRLERQGYSHDQIDKILKEAMQKQGGQNA